MNGVDDDSDGETTTVPQPVLLENCSNLDPNTLLPVDDDGDGDANCDDSVVLQIQDASVVVKTVPTV